MSDVTQILQRIETGDSAAANDLLPLVYEELRKLAAAKMSAERPDHTLQATALSLVKANELAAEELENKDNPPPWNRKLTLELLRSEAEELIEPAEDHEPDSPSPPEENND